MEHLKYVNYDNSLEINKMAKKKSNVQVQQINNDNYFIFVDFDGVLHSITSSDTFTRTQYLYYICVALIKFLNVKHIKIVVSSSWRSHHSVEQLTNLIIKSNDNIRELYNNGMISFDKTGTELHSVVVYNDDLLTDDVNSWNNRYLEVKKYIIDNSIKDNIIILDDISDLFFVTADYHLNDRNQYRATRFIITDKQFVDKENNNDWKIAQLCQDSFFSINDGLTSDDVMKIINKKIGLKVICSLN